jgi:hypothetical protein
MLRQLGRPLLVATPRRCTLADEEDDDDEDDDDDDDDEEEDGEVRPAFGEVERWVDSEAATTKDDDADDDDDAEAATEGDAVTIADVATADGTADGHDDSVDGDDDEEDDEEEDEEEDCARSCWKGQEPALAVVNGSLQMPQMHSAAWVLAPFPLFAVVLLAAAPPWVVAALVVAPHWYGSSGALPPTLLRLPPSLPSDSEGALPTLTVEPFPSPKNAPDSGPGTGWQNHFSGSSPPPPPPPPPAFWVAQHGSAMGPMSARP